MIKNGRFTYATCAGKNSKTPNRLMLHNSQCFMIGNTMLWSIFFFRSAWISPPRIVISEGFNYLLICHQCHTHHLIILIESIGILLNII